MSIPLSDTQRNLLKWLSGRESSILIECDGPDLHYLVNHFFARIDPPPRNTAPMFARVRITPQGLEALEDDE